MKIIKFFQFVAALGFLLLVCFILFYEAQPEKIYTGTVIEITKYNGAAIAISQTNDGVDTFLVVLPGRKNSFKIGQQIEFVQRKVIVFQPKK